MVKFRVWDQASKRYGRATALCDIEAVGDGSYFLKPFTENYQIELSTSQRDSRGIEIFEGDIVEGFGRRFTIKFGSAIREIVTPLPAAPGIESEDEVNEVEIIGFYWEDMVTKRKLFNITNNFKGEHDLQSMVVVGNIHQIIL